MTGASAQVTGPLDGRPVQTATCGGQATARAIAGARFEVIEGMGHDLPDRRVAQALLPTILEHVHSHPG